MKLVLGKDFPASPPQGFFLTKIFHPNVAKNGAICVNTLKRDWKPEHGIKHILLVSTGKLVGGERGGVNLSYEMVIIHKVQSKQSTVFSGSFSLYDDYDF